MIDKWGWYIPIYQLAGEDVLKMEEVVQLPIRTVLTHLVFLKDYQILSK